MKLLSKYEVAEVLGCTPRAAHETMKKMNRVEINAKQYRVTEEELNRWIASCTVAPAQNQPRPHKRPVVKYDPNLFEPDGRIKRRRA